MKKYLKLTANDAIRQFILKDSTLAPEASLELEHKINDLEKFRGKVAVSIVIPTHRTKPDYEKDVIELKNAIDETEKQLLEKYEKRLVWTIMENIREAQDTIDYSLNLDSLVLYANEHFSSVVKLPVELEKSILIGKEFNLIPLYKTRQQNRRFWIITVSKQKIRLIEAFNDKIEREIEKGDFPFIKNEFYTVNPQKKDADDFIDNKEKEFYNDADKSFQAYYNENPLPVVLAGDVKSVAYYEEEMDDSCPVIGRVPGSFDERPLHEIIRLVQPEVIKYRESQRKNYLEQIDQAISANLFTTDPLSMIEGIQAGAGHTLFVSEQYSPDTLSKDDKWKKAENLPSDVEPDDVLQFMMTQANERGGSVVFLDKAAMQPYQGLALAKRY